MKKGLHPDYGPVAFRDRSTGMTVVINSTLVASAGERAIEVGGARYPLVEVDVSSDSHPFWTGQTRTLDTEGRLQAFERRYGRRA